MGMRLEVGKACMGMRLEAGKACMGMRLVNCYHYAQAGGYKLLISRVSYRVGGDNGSFPSPSLQKSESYVIITSTVTIGYIQHNSKVQHNYRINIL